MQLPFDCLSTKISAQNNKAINRFNRKRIELQITLEII